jgi:hypothetical protein
VSGTRVSDAVGEAVTEGVGVFATGWPVWVAVGVAVDVGVEVNVGTGTQVGFVLAKMERSGSSS